MGNGTPEGIRSDRILENVNRMLPEQDSGKSQDGWRDMSGSQPADITEGVTPGTKVQLENGSRTFTRTVTTRHENNGVLEFADGTTYQPHVQQYDRVRAYVGEDADDEGPRLDEVAKRGGTEPATLTEDTDEGDGGDHGVDGNRSRRITESHVSGPGELADYLDQKGYEVTNMNQASGAWSMEKGDVTVEYADMKSGGFRYRVFRPGERFEDDDPQAIVDYLKKVGESRNRPSRRGRRKRGRRRDSDLTDRLDEALDEMDRAVSSGLSHSPITDTGPPHSFRSGDADPTGFQDPSPDSGVYTGKGERERGEIPSSYNSAPDVGSGGYQDGPHMSQGASRGARRERRGSDQNFSGPSVSDRKEPDRMTRQGDRESVRHVGPHVETLSQAEMVARKLEPELEDKRMSERLNKLARRCRNMAERARNGNADPEAVRNEAERAYRTVSTALERAGYDVEEAMGK